MFKIMYICKIVELFVFIKNSIHGLHYKKGLLKQSKCMRLSVVSQLKYPALSA